MGFETLRLLRLSGEATKLAHELVWVVLSDIFSVQPLLMGKTKPNDGTYFLERLSMAKQWWGLLDEFAIIAIGYVRQTNDHPHLKQN